MIEKKINLWDIPDEDGVKAVTTNGITYLDAMGVRQAVMGAGIALGAKKKYRYITSTLGKLLKEKGNIPFYLPEFNVITFPTKNEWRKPSTLELIAESAESLVKLVVYNDIKMVFLPRPGTGLGGLNYEKEVRPILEKIFDDSEVSDKITIVDWP